MKTQNNDTAAYSITVHGRVQGVGFRYTAQAAAKRIGVTGWVKNEWDGSVALYCEGPREKVERFVQWCRQGPPSALVTDIDLHEKQPAGRHRSFSIAM